MRENAKYNNEQMIMNIEFHSKRLRDLTKDIDSRQSSRVDKIIKDISARFEKDLTSVESKIEKDLTSVESKIEKDLASLENKIEMENQTLVSAINEIINSNHDSTREIIKMRTKT